PTEGPAPWQFSGTSRAPRPQSSPADECGQRQSSSYPSSAPPPRVVRAALPLGPARGAPARAARGGQGFATGSGSHSPIWRRIPLTSQPAPVVVGRSPASHASPTFLGFQPPIETCGGTKLGPLAVLKG